MSEADRGYELKVLKMVINKHLDETTSITEESLRALEVNCDQIVWDLATKIYSQSGHQVELSTVRDVVNSRIGAIKHQLAAEKERIAEQIRRAAEQKAQVFVRVQQIISDQLGVEKNEINLNSHLSNDLGADADSYELLELVMALEGEFDIEISDSEAEDELGIHYSSYGGTGSGSFWGMLSSISAMSSSSYSSSGSAGEKCVVASFVDLIHKKLHG